MDKDEAGPHRRAGGGSSLFSIQYSIFDGHEMEINCVLRVVLLDKLSYHGCRMVAACGVRPDQSHMSPSRCLRACTLPAYRSFDIGEFRLSRAAPRFLMRVRISHAYGYSAECARTEFRIQSMELATTSPVTQRRRSGAVDAVKCIGFSSPAQVCVIWRCGMEMRWATRECTCKYWRCYCTRDFGCCA